MPTKGVEYGYEQPLTIDGVTKYPDFTIEDMESGQTFYWEHCGMLHVPSYRRRWEEKARVVPEPRHPAARRRAAAQNGTLIVTRDEANGSIDSARITKLIAEVFGS